MKRFIGKKMKRLKMESICFAYACNINKPEKKMTPKEKKVFIRKAVNSISKETKFSLRVVRESLRNEIADYEEKRRMLIEIFED